MLDGLRCPICNSLALSPLDKLLLSPPSVRICKQCGMRYSSSDLTLTLAALVSIALASYGWFLRPARADFALAAGVAIVFYAVVQVFLMPLVPRSAPE